MHILSATFDKRDSYTRYIMKQENPVDLASVFDYGDQPIDYFYQHPVKSLYNDTYYHNDYVLCDNKTGYIMLYRKLSQAEILDIVDKDPDVRIFDDPDQVKYIHSDHYQEIV